MRHGESEGNQRGEVGGKDLQLSDAGQMHAVKLAERVENLQVDKLVVSDFIRAQQTIAPTAALTGLVPEVVPAFGEMLEPSKFFGCKENDPVVLAYREDRNANAGNPDWSYEDGESYTDIQQRINTARSYLESLPEDNVLVVSHAYFICLFTGAILLDRHKADDDIFRIAKTLSMSNVGISHLTFEAGQWRVVMHNDHAHFAE